MFIKLYILEDCLEEFQLPHLHFLYPLGEMQPAMLQLLVWDHRTSIFQLLGALPLKIFNHISTIQKPKLIIDTMSITRKTLSFASHTDRIHMYVLLYSVTPCVKRQVYSVCSVHLKPQITNYVHTTHVLRNVFIHFHHVKNCIFYLTYCQLRTF